MSDCNHIYNILKFSMVLIDVCKDLKAETSISYNKVLFPNFMYCSYDIKNYRGVKEL